MVDRIQARVLDGMGLIALHSAHFSKIFMRLMGTGCDLKWRVADERERLWVVAPGHPIAAGLPERIELEHEEMYGEHFDIPPPDELVFLSWFQGGEVFRSGCCFRRGAGRIFYFRPGHETYPTYHQPLIQQVIANAVRWAAPVADRPPASAAAPSRWSGSADRCPHSVGRNAASGRSCPSRLRSESGCRPDRSRSGALPAGRASGKLGASSEGVAAGNRISYQSRPMSPACGAAGLRFLPQTLTATWWW